MNTRILLSLLLVAILALGGCSAPSTLTAIIVDIKNKPVPKGGTTVTVSSGTEVITKSQTVADGSAILKVINPVFPVTITASDNEHRFSVVTLTSMEQLRGTINIVQNPRLVVGAQGTEVK